MWECGHGFLFCLLRLLPFSKERDREGEKNGKCWKSVLIACACWLRSVIAAERMLAGSYNQTFTTLKIDSQRDDATTTTQRRCWIVVGNQRRCSHTHTHSCIHYTRQRQGREKQDSRSWLEVSGAWKCEMPRHNHFSIFNLHEKRDKKMISKSSLACLLVVNTKSLLVNRTKRRKQNRNKPSGFTRRNNEHGGWGHLTFSFLNIFLCVWISAKLPRVLLSANEFTPCLIAPNGRVKKRSIF